MCICMIFYHKTETCGWENSTWHCVYIFIYTVQSYNFRCLEYRILKFQIKSISLMQNSLPSLSPDHWICSGFYFSNMLRIAHCAHCLQKTSMTIHKIDLIQSSSNQDCNFSNGQIDFPIAKHSNCCQL